MSFILDSYTLDLGDDSGVAITKSIYDVVEPESRKSSFTKTITVPSSKQNDKVLSGLFDVNFQISSDNQFDPFFNPSKKAPCYLHTDTHEQITGYAQINDIVLNRYTNKVEYKLTIYGEISDIFSLLGDRKLSDLDLSKYNHPYNKATIMSSWEYDVYENGVLQTYSEGGNGYVYPQVDYGDGHDKYNGSQLVGRDYWNTEHFRPWIYVKTIIDKIFEEAGYSYYSEFINGETFKKLIYQGDVNGLTFTNDEIQELTVVASRSSTQDLGIVGDTANPTFMYSDLGIDFDTETLDPSGAYASEVWSVPLSTRYTIGTTLRVRITPSNPNAFQLNKIEIGIGAVKSDGAIGFGHTFIINTTDVIPALGSYDLELKHSTEYMGFTSGEDVKICIVKCFVRGIPDLGSIGNYTDFNVEVLTGSSFYVQPIATVPKDGEVNISQMLSPDMTQKQFLMSIVKMFNLYIEPYWFKVGDANSGKYAQYLIEPRDDYFTNDVIDWTSKLDTEKDFTIKPLALSKYKYYLFTYKEDNDYLNSLYKGATGRIYGDYAHFIDNDFASETKKIEIDFSPCIVSNSSGSGAWSRTMPVNKPESGGVRQDSKPKILFYQGLFGANSSWTFEDELQSNQPYAGQLDSYSSPTLDLNFKYPSVLYYKGDNGAVNLTTSTLFNKFYYRQMVELNDRNSKVIECYMRLLPEDVHNLSFRPLYFINDAYYRLYKVTDHKYDGQTTLCTFLKINVASPVTQGIVTTRGGFNLDDLDDKLPTIEDPTRGESLKDKFDNPVEEGEMPPPMTGSGGGRLTDGNFGTNVLQGGTSKGVILKNDIISFGFNYMNIASGSTTLNGQEGSPMYVIADTDDGNALLILPDYTEFFGMSYFVKKNSNPNQFTITDHLDSVVVTITDGTTYQILLTETGAELF